jgi:hypothetical protein
MVSLFLHTSSENVATYSHTCSIVKLILDRVSLSALMQFQQQLFRRTVSDILTSKADSHSEIST